MESKRKTRKVLKAPRATQEPESHQPQDKPTSAESAESLIRYNGELVESLYISPVWNEIVKPLIEEGIASVSGRLTNGHYYYGEMTKSDTNRDFSAGYQKALMDFSNHIHNFVLVKNKMIDKHRREKENVKANVKAEVINPFMEEEDES